MCQSVPEIRNSIVFKHVNQNCKSVWQQNQQQPLEEVAHFIFFQHFHPIFHRPSFHIFIINLLIIQSAGVLFLALVILVVICIAKWKKRRDFMWTPKVCSWLKCFFVAFWNVTKHSLQRWMSVIFMSHTTQRGRPATTALERTPTENECQEKTVFQNLFLFWYNKLYSNFNFKTFPCAQHTATNLF